MGTYLRNLAMSLIGQLNISPEELIDASLGERCEGFGAQVLYDRRCLDISTLLRKMRPETLGKIIAKGGGDAMYLVHCETWLGKDWEGLDYLVEIACTAIVAEMTAILRARRATEKVTPALTS